MMNAQRWYLRFNSMAGGDPCKAGGRKAFLAECLLVNAGCCCLPRLMIVVGGGGGGVRSIARSLARTHLGLGLDAWIGWPLVVTAGDSVRGIWTGNCVVAKKGFQRMAESRQTGREAVDAAGIRLRGRGGGELCL